MTCAPDVTALRHQRTYRMPKGFSLTLHMREGRLSAIWAPHIPAVRKRAAAERFTAAYKRARREFFEEVATMIQGNVAVVDYHPDGEFELTAIEPATRQ